MVLDSLQDELATLEQFEQVLEDLELYWHGFDKIPP
jgi:hypothetical protein